KVNVKPFTNLSEFFKGQVSGVYVQQPSGETGSYQNIIVRGAGSTLFSNADINQVRPTVFVNGVPMVTNHSFAYETQLYKYNRIGPCGLPPKSWTTLCNIFDMMSSVFYRAHSI